MYLFDTNILIYIAKNKPQKLLHKFEQAKPGDLYMSVITYGELRYGVEKSNHKTINKQNLERLVTYVEILSLTEKVAESHGFIRAYLESIGAIIGANDLWIAAHALATNLILVTNNEKEFIRIPSLQVQNWSK